MSKNVTQDVLKLKLNDGCQTPSLNGWWLWSSQKIPKLLFPDVVVGGLDGPPTSPIIKEAVRIWAEVSNPKINSTINSGTTKSNNKTVSVTIFCRDINGGAFKNDKWSPKPLCYKIFWGAFPESRLKVHNDKK